MKGSFEKLLLRLGKKATDEILSAKIPENEIREIRFNVNKPIQIITKNKKPFVSKIIFSGTEICDIFASLCEYSVHTYRNEICEGFITIEGGFRIGICGTAVYDNKKIINVKDISALNIRIPHEIIGVADNLINDIEHGVLIVGPPCSGKTTLLRDTARQISKNNLTVIVDERMEISGTWHGEPYFNVGNSVVLNGFLKSDGIKNASRVLSPDYIICDEFGDENDISSALYAMKSGANIIASMHAFDKNDFLNKPFVDVIMKYHIFGCFAFINKYCKLYEILKADDLTL